MYVNGSDFLERVFQWKLKNWKAKGRTLKYHKVANAEADTLLTTGRTRESRWKYFSEAWKRGLLEIKIRILRRDWCLASGFSYLAGGFLWGWDPDFSGGNPAWLVLDSLSSHFKAGSLLVWRTGNWIPLLLLKQTPALGWRIVGKMILTETGSRQEANLEEKVPSSPSNLPISL